jgi:hypothetical protein
MTRRLLAVLAASFMLVGLFGGAALANNGKAGPNGHNEKGLCTAYFNGQKNGHEEGDGPGPFGALEDEAEDNGDNENLPDEQQISDDVFEFCNEFGIMGQPEQNGRFDCREGEDRTGDPRDSDDDGEIECVPNGTETD